MPAVPPNELLLSESWMFSFMHGKPPNSPVQGSWKGGVVLLQTLPNHSPASVFLPSVVWADKEMGFVLRSKGKFHSLIKQWRCLSLSSGGLALPASHGQGCCIGISSWGERGIHGGLQGRAARAPGHTARCQPPGLRCRMLKAYWAEVLLQVLHTRNAGLKCWVRSLYSWHPMASETQPNTKEKKHTKRLDFIIQLFYLFSGNCSWAVPVTLSFQPVIQKLSSVLTCSSHLGCRYYQHVASKVYYEFHLSILKEYRMWKRWICILKAVAREEYICIT